jgi:hypothetical protein
VVTNQSTEFESFISDLKSKVGRMLEERAKLPQERGFHRPAALWNDAVVSYRYLMNLSAEDFLLVRSHYDFQERFGYGIGTHSPPDDPQFDDLRAEYDSAIDGLPTELWLSEPLVPTHPIPMGVLYRERYINWGIVRYQRCVANLYMAGAFDVLSRAYGDEPYVIIEIGGGYGGLAHYLAKVLPGNPVVLIIDLPELFMFQGPFLQMNNLGKSVRVYDPLLASDQTAALEGDFILWPNIAIDQLDDLPNIAMAFNTLSFQEMTAEQVETYVEFVSRKVELLVYSENGDKHPYSPEPLNVSSILEKHFELWPRRDEYDRFPGPWLIRKYFGLPRDKPLVQELHLPDKRHMAGTVFGGNQSVPYLKSKLPTPLRTMLRRLRRFTPI